MQIDVRDTLNLYYQNVAWKKKKEV